MELKPSNKVIILEKVYQSMMHYAKDNPKNEVIGIFFGKICNAEGNGVEKGDIVIEKSYNFRVGGKTEVDFLDEDYVKAVPIIKKNDKLGLKWLGWFHSHPFEKGGNHLYMSRKDIFYQTISQKSNPFWTALVLNPHKIKDKSTTQGSKAFRLKYSTKKKKYTKKIIELKIFISS